MKYSQRFSEISLCFAQKVAEVAGQLLDRALLHYTNLSIRLRLGWDLSAPNPIWQAYLATAQAGGHDFPYLPLWGQFIDHRGRVKEDLAAQFLECLDRQHSLSSIEQCFPFQVLHLESSAHEFYQFYDV